MEQQLAPAHGERKGSRTRRGSGSPSRWPHRTQLQPEDGLRLIRYASTHVQNICDATSDTAQRVDRRRDHGGTINLRMAGWANCFVLGQADLRPMRWWTGTHRHGCIASTRRKAGIVRGSRTSTCETNMDPSALRSERSAFRGERMISSESRRERLFSLRQRQSVPPSDSTVWVRSEYE